MVRNWDKWQTYRRDRGQPPWIKVHRHLMRDHNWIALSDAERGQLVSIWIVAADRDGRIPADPHVLRKICCLASTPDLQTFIEHGFIEAPQQGDVTATSRRRHGDAPEAEAEERRGEEKNPLRAREASETETIHHVLERCNEVTGRDLTLTSDRKRKILARLRDGFAPDELVDAMRGAHADPFFRGENDRGRRYDDPLTVYKNSGSVEGHLEHWNRVKNGKAPVNKMSKQQKREYETLRAAAEFAKGDEDA